MRILTYSTLYPNSIQPRHGIFVETRLRHLLEGSQVEAQVVAPVPWFPFRHRIFGSYAKFAAVPDQETRNGLRVYHPRFPVIPKFGMVLAPFFLALASLPRVLKLKRDFDFQLIDAHYFYPDGVAAAILAKRLRVPLIITARGTDINVFPSFYWPRKMILWAAESATRIITVSNALKEKVLELGAAESKVHVVQNGVDLNLFRPLSGFKKERKDHKSICKFNFISVGNLVENKGHHLVVEMMKSFPESCLKIVGDGPMLGTLEKQISEQGLRERVQIRSADTQERLCELYNEADVLILASSREGCPNVLLEAMACGTPVVATGVGGVKEIILNRTIGMFVSSRSVKELRSAVHSVIEDKPDRNAIRNNAEKFSWKECTLKQLEIFENITFAEVDGKYRRAINK